MLKGNFSASTSYEWHTKAWCTGNVDELGNSDPQYHSGWGEFSEFATEDICEKLPIIFLSSNGANTAITMSWDTPLSGEPDHCSWNLIMTLQVSSGSGIIFREIRLHRQSLIYRLVIILGRFEAPVVVMVLVGRRFTQQGIIHWEAIGWRAMCE